MNGENENDPWADWDGPVLDEYVADAGVPREGYWTPYSVFAWIASRDNRIVAAVQAYEADHDANREGAFDAWIALGDDTAARFGMNFTEASEKMREALESGRLTGGIATDARTGELVELQRPIWTRWRCSFERAGLMLIPGLVDFQWPAKAVRQAFPAHPENVSISPATSNVEIERWMQRAPTGEQKLLVAFFKDAKNHLEGGTDRITRTQLLEKYEAWLLTKQKSKFALKRSAFELWLGRFEGGARARPDGCGWENCRNDVGLESG
ncbi:MAG: hypothetical protein Q8R44_00865 [Novosphingobium sp.]|nr:hypothetical protein [Novosphingobium sp.]